MINIINHLRLNYPKDKYIFISSFPDDVYYIEIWSYKDIIKFGNGKTFEVPDKLIDKVCVTSYLRNKIIDDLLV